MIDHEYYDTGSDQPYCGKCGLHYHEHIKHQAERSLVSGKAVLERLMGDTETGLEAWERLAREGQPAQTAELTYDPATRTYRLGKHVITDGALQTREGRVGDIIRAEFPFWRGKR